MCLTQMTVSGHAPVKERAVSVACAAVSAIVRTAGRLIEMRHDIVSGGEAEEAGTLDLVIRERQDSAAEWLRGVTDFLVVGLKGVERDYPEECEVVVQTQEE
jgi:uncharacterized protein YsxB (DUF464 family)